MDQSTVDELLFQINGKVEGISAKLDSLTDTLLKHEARISLLEKDVQVALKHEARISLLEKDVLAGQKSEQKGDFKVELLKLLAKCVLISVSALAALAGASELVSSILK